MIWPMIEFCANIYQGLIMTYYVNKRCDLRQHPLWYDCILIAAITIVICILDRIGIFVLDDVVFLVPLVYALLLNQRRSYMPVFWCIVLCFVFSIDATISSSFISLFTQKDWNAMLEQSDVRLMYIISANLLHTVLIVIICNIGRKNREIPRTTTICFLCALVAQCAAAECFFVLRINVSDSINAYTYGTIALLISMILTIILYEMAIRQAELQRKMELEAQTSRLIDAHQEELRTVYSDMLHIQHDLRHRIAAAEHMLKEDAGSKGQQAIALLKDTGVLNEYITGSIGVDAVLTAKTAVMQEAGIHFSFSSCPLNTLPIPEKQFTVMLSNILDNAIEGVMRLPPTAPSRTIHLTFSITWDIFYISCENDMDPGTVKRKNGSFISSKSQQHLHGFGVKSIQDIVNRAGGDVDFVLSDTKFAVKIMLPME